MIIMIVSYILSYKKNIILPWGISTVLVAGIFFYTGNIIKEYKILEKMSTRKELIISLISLLIGSFFAFINGKTVSYINYEYGNLTYAYISGFLLSFATILISKIISNNRLLEYIGKNTMGILIFHKIVVLIFQTKLGLISKILRGSNLILEMLISFIVVILSIIISLIATIIIRKYSPIAIGEIRKEACIK